MTNKGAYMTEFEKNCYGMSAADIREQYMESLTGRVSGLEMVVMSILSDCQELLAFDGAVESGSAIADSRRETVRKQMNVAKFILCEMMDAKEAV